MIIQPTREGGLQSVTYGVALKLIWEIARESRSLEYHREIKKKVNRGGK